MDEVSVKDPKLWNELQPSLPIPSVRVLALAVIVTVDLA